MSVPELAVESSHSQPRTDPEALPNLNRAPFEIRALKSGFLTGLTWIAALLASVPLFSVIYMLVIAGGSRLNWEALTALPPSAFEKGGGFGNAIVGTLVMVGIATLISVPHRHPGRRLSGDPRSRQQAGAHRALSGQGVDGISFHPGRRVRLRRPGGDHEDLLGAGRWGRAGRLMLPTVVLAAEQAMTMVPKKMKDAAFGMGCTRTQVIWKVVLPTGAPGILTGVMLAIAGAAGNSAPLLFTALFSGYYLTSLTEPTASLAILIFNFSGMPYDNQIELAWAASLVLVLIVLVFNILARIIGRQKH